MPTELEPNEFLMRCACGDLSQHVAWLIYEPDDVPGHDDWLLMTSLDRRFGFWRRLWTGLRYIFRPTRLRYYGFSELVLRNEDMDALVAFIQKHRPANP